MGKASNKKVARAAGTGGGRTNRGRTPWTYYGVIVVVIILGVAGAWTSRNHRLSVLNATNNTDPPTLGSTQYAAYAVNICGKIEPNIPTPKTNPTGITTQGDGIVHISPSKASATGKHATLGLFASSVGMKLTAAQLQLPGGKLYTDGDKCEGSTGHIYVQHFSYPLDKTGVLETTEANQIHLDSGAMYTIAFLPASKKNSIPPPAQPVITKLQSLQAAASSTTTAPATGSGLAPSTPATTTAGSATTAAGSATTTAGSGTTTAGSGTTTAGSGTTVATTVPASPSTTK